MSDTFSLKCFHCGEVSDFTGDNWHDEFVDDSQDHEIPCLHCSQPITVRVHLDIRLESIEVDEDGDEVCNETSDAGACRQGGHSGS